MCDNIPSQNQEPLSRCKALYLGASLFNPSSKNVNEANLSLSQLQDSIAERYPIDGSNFAKGIQTWLSVFPGGVQMEHASSKDLSSISALFYYPIKSLVYCGALRFIDNLEQSEKDLRGWRFVPLDTEIAQKSENVKNPPLFAIFLKGIDPNTKKQIIECHVYVVGMIKTAMKLIESCQKAFNLSKESVSDFYRKFGNIPVVYCLKNDLTDKSDKRVVVKQFDQNGYFYATETTPIDLWQLFEENEKIYEPLTKSKSLGNYSRKNKNEFNVEIFSDTATSNKSEKNLANIKLEKRQSPKTVVNPYEKSDNLIKVEKRVDPVTGQKIYVRYLAEKTNDTDKNNKIKKNKSKVYDFQEKFSSELNDDENDIDNMYDKDDQDNYDVDNLTKEKKNKSNKNKGAVLYREEKTPSPIIVEKFVKKRAPQVIIKEIHVSEPAPPPVKIIETIENQYHENNYALNGYQTQAYQTYQPYVPRPTINPVPPLNPTGPQPLNLPHAPPIRMNRPLANNYTYTNVRTLLNQVYGSPDYTNLDPYLRDPYPLYSNPNKTLPYDPYSYRDTITRKPMKESIYDFNPLDPARLYSNPISTLKNRSKDYKDDYIYSSEPKNYYDRYSNTMPSNSKKMYTEHRKFIRSPAEGGLGNYVKGSDLSTLPRYSRNVSSAKIETRQNF